MVDRVLRVVLKTISNLLAFVFAEAWQKPAGIRGQFWTFLWWTRTACFLAVAVYAAIGPGGPGLLVILIGSHIWLHFLNKKPVKLGRPLPYRRRR